MIIDGFIFYNELDLLELRLIELDPIVDIFILVQADSTFRGDPKPYFFNPEDPRWEKYINKIRLVNVEMPRLRGTWEREAYQRNQISETMKEICYFDPESVCMISDADEIPRREAVEEWSTRLDDLHRFPHRLTMRAYYYALNVRTGDEGSVRMLLADDLTTAEEIRHSDPRFEIPNAGWHFSYLGDAEFIRNKIKAFSHSELDLPQYTDLSAIEGRMRSLKDLYDRGSFVLEEVDDTWPVAVRENPEFWSKHIWSK